MVAFFLVQAGVQAAIATRKISWAMHAGGLFCGMGMSFLFIPNLCRSSVLDRIIPWIVFLTVLVFFFFFPVAIFTFNTPILQECSVIAM